MIFVVDTLHYPQTDVLEWTCGRLERMFETARRTAHDREVADVQKLETALMRVELAKHGKTVPAHMTWEQAEEERAAALADATLPSIADLIRAANDDGAPTHDDE